MAQAFLKLSKKIQAFIYNRVNCLDQRPLAQQVPESAPNPPRTSRNYSKIDNKLTKIDTKPTPKASRRPSWTYFCPRLGFEEKKWLKLPKIEPQMEPKSSQNLQKDAKKTSTKNRVFTDTVFHRFLVFFNQFWSSFFEPLAPRKSAALLGSAQACQINVLYLLDLIDLSTLGGGQPGQRIKDP